MLEQLLQTETDYIITFLRVVAGVIILPYGMQKLLGRFDGLGPGAKATIRQTRDRHLPVFIGWLVIIGQSFGSIALITGCLGRIAAAGNFIIFTGALLAHAKDGWTMNWFSKKKGEGIEYFILLLAILLVVILKGSGPLSIDQELLKLISH